MSDVKIDVINAELPKQCLEMVRNIYNHKDTNRHTRHVIRFELQKMFGPDTDIKHFLNDKSPL